MEQMMYLENKLGDSGLTFLYNFCQHHQAALVKKPIILSFPGLATGQCFCSFVGSQLKTDDRVCSPKYISSKALV